MPHRNVIGTGSGIPLPPTVLPMANPVYLKYRRPNARQAASEAGRRFLLRRAVVQWLFSQGNRPDGFALDVPTSMTSDRGDVAAFWSVPVRIDRRTLLSPLRTCIVICALDRKECYAASINPDALYNELSSLRKELSLLEEQIRRQEPELRDSHSLFEEYAEWDYAHSQNPQYQISRNRMLEISEKLYRGTRMERIQKNVAATELYVAIPEGTVFTDEVMPGWGVLSVSPDGLVTQERPAPLQTPSPEAQLHLVQKIAQGAAEYMLAGLGLRRRK